MNCPQCGHPNLAGAAFCDNCGFDLNQAPPPPAPMQPVYAPPPAPAAPAYTSAPAAMPTAAAMGGGGAVCSQCGTPAQPGAGFCDNCGAPIGAPAPQAAPTWQSPAQPAYQAPVQPPYQPAPAAGGTCPNCRMPVMPGAGFCDNCGAALSGAPVQPPAPGWQQPVQPIGAMRMQLVVAASGAQIPLAGKQEFLIGREDPIGNVFPDADLGPHGGDTGGVSRNHAKILVRGNQVLVEDLNSTNGTWVNKVKVQPGQPAPVTNGSEIRLGKVALIFQMS